MSAVRVFSPCKVGGVRPIVCFVFVVLGACASLQAGSASALPPLSLQFDNPSWSPDGKWLAFSDGNRNGLYLYSTADKTTIQIADSPSTGYACNWSPDGTKLGFKLLVPNGESFLHLPAWFDIQNRQVVPLCPAAAQAGVPSFSAGGLIAFTVGEELRVVDDEGGLVASIPLDHYANLAPISPDGKWVACNDPDDRLVLVDLATGEKRLLTPEGSHFGPVWSPDSSRLVVSTLGGRLKAIEVATGQIFDLDDGDRPSWAADSRTIFYSKIERVDGVEVTAARIWHIQADGTGKSALDQPAEELRTAARVAPDGQKIAFASLRDGQLYEMPLTKPKALQSMAPATAKYAPGPAVKLDVDISKASPVPGALSVAKSTAAQPLSVVQPAAQIRISRTVPYIHQVYDTPNEFNGHWACGATSAMMCISYYNILPYWDCTVSVPYSHVSHYGRYISQIYTFNGYTYNYGAADPNGRIAYGGYGYIVRNNWKDTKGYMRDYFTNHGLSYVPVDWSPTWSELRTEIDNQYPFVLLNSLTTSGHYIVTIGYFDSQHTAIFNDPYGNKNTPGYPSYDGAGACYDWPGYNNGYQNLNTVHCFIFARGNLAPVITTQPQPQSVCPGSTATFTVVATGTGTLSYQWQKNGSNLSNGGHYSGVTTATLTVSNASAADAANYRCVVTSSGGSSTSNQAALTLLAPVSITQQPTAQTVTLGGSVSFTIAGNGAGPLTYQWQKNGSNLSDDGRYSGAQSATLTIHGAEKNDGGTYRCVLTGNCGSTTSNGAVLTVKPLVAADFDLDRDVDGADLNALRACLSGAGAAPYSGCEDKDLDGDGDVDQDDFGILQRCMSGLAVADPACDD